MSGGDAALWALIASGMGVLVLLVLSAFFSGSETALTAASRGRLAQLEREGDRRAARVNRLREDKERLIGALLLGNNAVNILASALVTSLLIGLVGEAAVPIATVAMTLLVLIFGEVLPKTYAIHNAESVALRVVRLVGPVVTIFAPVTAAVTAIVRGIFRLFGADIQQVNVGHNIEELRGAIELHRGSADETDAERAMLRSILDLSNVEVSEIMTHRRNMLTIDIGQEPEEIVSQVLASTYTRIPLWKDESDNIVGILHVKDMLRAMKEARGDASKIDAAAIAKDPWFIPDTTTLHDQLQAFREHRGHLAVVVDEYGSLQGIVTLEDILEEIVGEIVDEHDRPVTGVRLLGNGGAIVDGTVTIRDLNRQFEWSLPDESAATVAGLVLHEAQRIPEVGQVFTFYGFRFEILRRQRNQITSIRITPHA